MLCELGLITRAGSRQLITAACAFGNSLTLPLAFLAALVPPGAAFDRAAGYTALCALAWAPLMWALGHQLLSKAVFTAPPPRPGDWASYLGFGQTLSS